MDISKLTMATIMRQGENDEILNLQGKPPISRQKLSKQCAIRRRSRVISPWLRSRMIRIRMLMKKWWAAILARLKIKRCSKRLLLRRGCKISAKSSFTLSLISTSTWWWLYKQQIQKRSDSTSLASPLSATSRHSRFFQVKTTTKTATRPASSTMINQTSLISRFQVWTPNFRPC